MQHQVLLLVPYNSLRFPSGREVSDKYPDAQAIFLIGDNGETLETIYDPLGLADGAHECTPDAVIAALSVPDEQTFEVRLKITYRAQRSLAPDERDREDHIRDALDSALEDLDLEGVEEFDATISHSYH